MEPSRVFLCHRNRLLSDCLAVALVDPGRFQCVVLDSIDPLKYLPHLSVTNTEDLLLLDPTVGGTSQEATTIARGFKERFPRLKLALFISHLAVDRLIEFAGLQSHGCILDSMPLFDVRRAVATILGGSPYCSPELAHSLLSRLGRGIDLREETNQRFGVRLTAREREILRLIEEKLSNKQIARRLYVSLFTVKNHVHNILQKLGAEDRDEAVQISSFGKLVFLGEEFGADSVTPILLRGLGGSDPSLVRG
jgi:DNA-binding NarL/FixJ family response regulator